MIRFTLEAIAFQLVFLLVYDLFLKKETFFQWNRAYLLFTFVFSLILPWIEVGVLKTSIQEGGALYSDFLWRLNTIELSASEAVGIPFWKQISMYGWIFLLGSGIMTTLFLAKLYRIRKLRKSGEVYYFKEFTQVIVKKSKIAFSFFKQVFLGDAIHKAKVPKIVAHELVHIRQWHSLDLLLFELLRVLFWFNPLVYIYQKRISELHEFIADSAVAKSDRMGQYQILLEEALQTQNVSFINQFFKESLIKKRIVMLTKQKSSPAKLLKYLALIPTLVLILLYTSCEADGNKPATPESTELNTGVETKQVAFMEVQDSPIFPGCENAEDARNCFIEQIQNHVRKHFNYPQEAQDLGIEGRVAVMFTIDKTGAVTNIQKRGPHTLLENEVERIIKRLPQMQPGKHKGEVVNVPFSLPVVFKLK